MQAQETLRKYFGHEAFRPGQEVMVNALTHHRDALGVMPTGAGKSMCYQVPALMLPGVAIVISPLISLMADQVAALKSAGVPAAYLNSSLTPRQMELAMQRARQIGKNRPVLLPQPLRLLEKVHVVHADQRPLRHAGKRGDGVVLGIVEQNVAVNLVADDKEIVLDCQLCQRL